METYSVREFKAHLSEILNNLESGDEVIITRRGKPCGRLTAPPLEEGNHSPRSLMGILATPYTPDWDYEELQGHIREVRDEWKAFTNSIPEENAE